MLAVATVLVLVAIPIGAVLGLLIPAVDILLIMLGVLLLAGRNPFERLPGTRVPIVANPFGQAYIYGLMLGPLALPCAGAFALSLIAFSVGLVETLPGSSRSSHTDSASGCPSSYCPFSQGRDVRKSSDSSPATTVRSRSPVGSCSSVSGSAISR